MDELEEGVYLSTPEADVAPNGSTRAALRAALLVVLLALAAALIASGVATWSLGAALIVGGVLLAVLAVLGLADLL